MVESFTDQFAVALEHAGIGGSALVQRSVWRCFLDPSVQGQNKDALCRPVLFEWHRDVRWLGQHQHFPALAIGVDGLGRQIASFRAWSMAKVPEYILNSRPHQGAHRCRNADISRPPEPVRDTTGKTPCILSHSAYRKIGSEEMQLSSAAADRPNGTFARKMLVDDWLRTGLVAMNG